MKIYIQKKKKNKKHNNCSYLPRNTEGLGGWDVHKKNQ